LVAHPHPVHPA